MTDDINLQPQARAWLSHSILHPHVPSHAGHLERGRYAPEHAACLSVLRRAFRSLADPERGRDRRDRRVHGHPFPLRAFASLRLPVSGAARRP
jgi:hypothetical protein